MHPRDRQQLQDMQFDTEHKARLLAASVSHSADCLFALPVTYCGLRLDNDAVRVAMALFLGLPLALPTRANVALK